MSRIVRDWKALMTHTEPRPERADPYAEYYAESDRLLAQITADADAAEANYLAERAARDAETTRIAQEGLDRQAERHAEIEAILNGDIPPD